MRRSGYVSKRHVAVISVNPETDEEREVSFYAEYEPADPSVGIMTGGWLVEDVRFTDTGDLIPDDLLERVEEDLSWQVDNEARAARADAESLREMEAEDAGRRRCAWRL